jgi:nitroimidazol reductase NimA-like FMN-containing flavoprotein (pyridoxamine 5'-phosphate oxidase superfamily)
MSKAIAKHRLEAIPPMGCERHLRSERVGRVAVIVDGHPEIFPVNYAVDPQGRIVFRTDAGTKLGAVVHASTVAFEVDGIDHERHGGWSVLVVGTARWLTDDEAAAAATLPLEPWAAGEKASFVRITPDKTTGRWIDLYREG